MHWVKWLGALLLSFSAWAQSDYQQNDIFLRYTDRIENNQIVERGVFSKAVPHFADLQRDQFRYNNYEQFLDYLLGQAPSLKKHFIVLHHSHSLQLASPEHPRVILFDGGMAFAVSEHPENRERRVEIMEVDSGDYRVHMREIVFKDGGIQFHAQPKACASCHGEPAKPLWDPYDFWPNAFGSSVGAFSTQQEKDAYEALKKNAGASPLLSRLQLVQQFDFGVDENTAFTQFIHQINLGRWMKQELTGKNLESIRFPLLATLNSCFSAYPRIPFADQKSALLSYFPQGMLGEKAALLDRIYDDVVNSRAHTKSYQDQLLAEYLNGADYINRIDHKRLSAESGDVALVRWLLDLAGVNGANLSTSHLANDYLFSSPSFFMLDALTVLFETRPDLFSGISAESQDLSTGRQGWLSLNCEELKQKSLAQNAPPSAASQWRSFERLQKERPVVSRCAKCHAEGMNPNAPHIPFEDSVKLAGAIRTGGLGERILERIQATDSRQMPPGQPLTPAEIAAMKEFIGALR